MASAITHIAVGASIGLLFDALPSAAPLPRRRLPLWAAALSVLPDADVLMHAFVAYSHPLGHRGFFHSPFFYLLLTAALAPLLARGGRSSSIVFGALFCSMLSHSLLDGLTNGGLGIAFAAPLSFERHFLPWRVIPVSPIGIREFFGPWGMRVLRVEVWIAAPALLAGVLSRSWARYRTAARASRSG